jgi:tetrapyrrole methylase family protein/MazG family protein
MKLSKNGSSPQKQFSELVAIMEKLRSKHGCPWDKHQTYNSLLPYLFSEAREFKKAVKKRDYENMAEELGDVLLQVVFHSQVAKEKGHFTISDVLHSINTKLIRRHPHVFGGKKVRSSKEVIKLWGEIKRQEKIDKKQNKK